MRHLKPRCTVKQAFRDAVTALVNGINTVIDAINGMIDRLQSVLDKVAKLPGMTKIELPKLGRINMPDMRDNDERRKAKPGAGDQFTNTPLPTRKPEFVGIEEAFRKAQVGAALDPARIAERERLGLMRDQLAATKQVANNTTPRPMAESIT